MNLVTNNKWIGQRTIRPDGMDKVTGRAQFAADTTMPGQIWGKVLRSPHPHARIKSIDTSKAEKLPGVKAVVTAKDIVDFTIEKGAVAQANFPDYEMIRLATCPQIEVYLHESDAPVGGAGEPGVPPTAPAVANAIFAATGVRVRDLPIKNHNLTVASR